jgi:hypothetical protein
MIKKIKKYFQYYKQNRNQLEEQNKKLLQEIQKQILIIKTPKDDKSIAKN